MVNYAQIESQKAYLNTRFGQSFVASQLGLSADILEGIVGRYTRGKRADKSHSYTGEKAPYEDPVFVAYNLFSLQADRVTYDEKSRIIEASGNVVVADGLGTTQRADAMSFEIDDGRATRLR